MTVIFLMVLSLGAPTNALADNGNAKPTLSFFSSGNGAHADWFVTDDQPPGDTDRQAIRLQTTYGGPTFAHGYAGILFHHLTGIPVEDFQDSSFWNKTPEIPYFGQPATLGTPRLIVSFQNAAGEYDGYADLQQNVRGNGWEHVSDVDDIGNSGWDTMGGAPCGYLYHVQWSAIQTCFAGDTTLSVYLTTDAYGIYHLIDDIEVNGKSFSSASDNSNGNNSSAGPLETLDLSLLPALPFPDLPTPR